MILVFTYCDYTSSLFSGVWHSKLLGTLRSKLGTKFLKYYLKVSAVSKSSVSRLPAVFVAVYFFVTYGSTFKKFFS